MSKVFCRNLGCPLCWYGLILGKMHKVFLKIMCACKLCMALLQYYFINRYAAWWMCVNPFDSTLCRIACLWTRDILRQKCQLMDTWYFYPHWDGVSGICVNFHKVMGILTSIMHSRSLYIQTCHYQQAIWDYCSPFPGVKHAGLWSTERAEVASAGLIHIL